MKNLVAKIFNKNNLPSFVMLAFVAFIAMVPEFAFAVQGTTNIKGILGDSTFQIGLTLGFAILAAFKWVSYFAGFDPKNALMDAIVPAVLTFLAFKWDMVIGWFGFI
jgi:hypothetical protein